MKKVDIPSTVHTWNGGSFEKCNNVTLIIYNNETVKEWAERDGLKCIAD